MAELQKKIAEKRRESLKERQKKNDELLGKVSKKLDEARESYEKAMNEFPSWAHLIGMQVLLLLQYFIISVLSRFYTRFIPQTSTLLGLIAPLIMHVIRVTVWRNK